MVRRVAIIGLGLIGGSIGMALKQSKPGETEVVGYVRRPEAVRKVLGMGAADRVEQSLASAVDKADVVILATPVLALEEILKNIGPHLPAGCLVTDVASTKAEVMEWAEEHLPPTVDFVGGHPMAGREVSGIEAAEADLFQGCTYCLVPGGNASHTSIQRMTDFVHDLEANPLTIGALEHDRAVAGISHLPLILSSALVTATTRDVSWPQMSKLAATGYRGLTRLASQHPRMNRDICVTNRENIVGWIDAFVEEIDRFRRIIAEGSEEEVEQAFIEARELRQRWLEDHVKND